MSKSLIGSNNIDKNKRPAAATLYLDDYAITENGGAVQFTNSRARYVAERGIDVHSYVQALEESLDATFNDGEFAECINENVLSAEFRPFNTDPTPISKHVLKSRSVTFLRNGLYDPSVDAPKVTAEPGDMLFVKPSVYTDSNGAMRTGVMASASTRVYDQSMMGGWTVGSLEMAVRGLMKDFCQNIIDNAVGILAKHEDLQKSTVALTGSSPREVAEQVMDALTVHVPLYLGELSEFCLAMPQRMEAILDRGAQAAGHQDAASMLGCDICSYTNSLATGDAHGAIFMVPKGYSMLSFRTDLYGDVVNIKATRVAQRACYDIELVSVFEVMAAGMVKVKDKANFDVLKDASFPLVHAIEFN